MIYDLAMAASIANMSSPIMLSCQAFLKIIEIIFGVLIDFIIL